MAWNLASPGARFCIQDKTWPGRSVNGERNGWRGALQEQFGNIGWQQLSEPVCVPAAKKANLILGAPNTAHAAHQKSDYPTALSVETASPWVHF